MKCDFCGNNFEINESKSGCSGCPMNHNCKKIKCPNCNYEMYPQPEIKFIKPLRSLFSSLFKRKDKSTNKRGEVFPLIALNPGEKATVELLKSNDAVKLRKLTSFGIMPGSDIIVVQKYPAYVLRVGFTQVALDTEIASEIMVTLKSKEVIFNGRKNNQDIRV